jgi:FkbM family methyltransferase
VTTLVYVGAHAGGTLSLLYRNFDKVYAFEPDPVLFEYLYSQFKDYPWVTLVNAACAEDDGEAELHILNGHASNSLSSIAWGDYEDVVMVKTVNLGRFLEENGVEYIDRYQSDTQGADLMILKTIEPFVRNRKIGLLEMETCWNGDQYYKDFDNRFDSFKAFLEPEYRPALGRRAQPWGYDNVDLDNLSNDVYDEWDTVWIPSA